MNYFLRNVFVILIVLIVIFFASCAAEQPPMTVYKTLTVPDGEYLHYTTYENGGLWAHYYFVTKHEIGKDGILYHRIYMDIHQQAEGTIPVKDYTTWPIWFLINTETGQLVEGKGESDRLDAYNFNVVGVRGLIYWKYKIADKGMYYEWRNIDLKTDKTTDYHTTMKFDNTYPISDQLWGYLEASRYLDSHGGKNMVIGVSPHLMKDVLPTTWKELSRGTVEVEAGTFKAIEYRSDATDPVLSVALSLFIPGRDKMSFWVEDSDRRLTVLYNTYLGQLRLVEVSTIEEKMDELI